jgi:hypothetical protein
VEAFAHDHRVIIKVAVVVVSLGQRRQEEVVKG